MFSKAMFEVWSWDVAEPWRCLDRGKTTRSPEGYPSICLQCAPPSYKLVNKSPSNYSYLRTINHSEIGVMCTNWTLSRGPHIAYICTICCLDFSGVYEQNLDIPHSFWIQHIMTMESPDVKKISSWNTKIKIYIMIIDSWIYKYMLTIYIYCSQKSGDEF